MEQRAAQAKAEAQMKNRHSKPQIMQHTPSQHCVSVQGYTNFYNFTDAYTQNNNSFPVSFNNTSPSAMQQRAPQNIQMQSPFGDFFDQNSITIQHSSPPTTTYNIH
jgi:hypothetical protein